MTTARMTGAACWRADGTSIGIVGGPGPANFRFGPGSAGLMVSTFTPLCLTIPLLPLAGDGQGGGSPAQHCQQNSRSAQRVSAAVSASEGHSPTLTPPPHGGERNLTAVRLQSTNHLSYSTAASPAAAPPDAARLLLAARRRRCRGAGETRRLPARFLPRRHHPPSTLELMQSSVGSTISSSLPHQGGRARVAVRQSVAPRPIATHASAARCKFIALRPQWNSLDFLAKRAARYPSCTMKMRAGRVDWTLVEEAGLVVGVQLSTDARGPLESAPDLVVAADGGPRSSARADWLASRRSCAPMTCFGSA